MKSKRCLWLLIAALTLLCLAPAALAEGLALIPRPLDEARRADILAQATQSLPRPTEDADAAEIQALLLDSLNAASPDDVLLLSPSPDGSGWLGVAGSVPFYLSTQTGEAIAIAVDVLGSAPNETYGLSPLLRLFQSPPANLYEANSFHWSPDGRYVALTFWRQVVQQFRGDVDLYVVDTQEGTLRVARTFEGTKLAQDTAAILQACFAQDSQTLYHTTYGSVDESRVTLWAQSLADGTVTRLASGDDSEAAIFGDLSQLVLLPDGSLLQVMDSNQVTAPRGVYRYIPGADGAWTRTAHTLPPSHFVPWEITLSQASGKGLLHFRTSAAGTLAISVLDPAAGFAGMDQLLLFRSLEAQQAEPLPLAEVTGRDAQPTEAALAAFSHNLLQMPPLADAAQPESPALLCLTAAMSPDGTQALLLMRDAAAPQFGFLLLDLATLHAEPVAFPWDEAVNTDIQVSWLRSALNLSWSQDNQVALSLVTGALAMSWE